MIGVDRYRHIGRTYVYIFRAPPFLAFGSWGSRPRLWLCRRFAASHIALPGFSFLVSSVPWILTSP